MALPATEDFTGTNGDQLSSLSDWTIVTGSDQDIQSNRCAPDASGSEQCCRWSSDSFGNDQYSEAEIYGSSAGISGPAARCSDSEETYYGYYGDKDGTSYLFKVVLGSWSELGSSTGVWDTDGQKARLECEGTTITPIWNGSTDTGIGAQVDEDISSGYAGVTAYGDDATACLLDNWEGGNTGEAPAATIIPLVMKQFRNRRAVA